MTGILKGKRVAVLLGGPGSEREVSLRSGAAVARAVRSLGVTVEEVCVTGTMRVDDATVELYGLPGGSGTDLAAAGTRIPGASSSLSFTLR